MVSKRKLRKIQLLSFVTESFEDASIPHTREIGGAPWWECQPSMWSDDETALWDLITGIEEKVKDGILKILAEK